MRNVDVVSQEQIAGSIICYLKIRNTIFVGEYLIVMEHNRGVVGNKNRESKTNEEKYPNCKAFITGHDKFIVSLSTLSKRRVIH